MFDVPASVILAQIILGLVNGSFYAVLSLGLSVVFGLLRVVNFTHGTSFMLGAFTALFLNTGLGLGFWPGLILAPLIVGLAAALLEMTLLRRIYGLDPIYGLLLTFGLVLFIESLFRIFFGSSGHPYPPPASLNFLVDLGPIKMPAYRLFVVVASAFTCGTVWYAIERTRLGAMLRAATERADLTRAFGVNVPMLLTGTFAAGSALAAFAGVLAAPILQVHSGMGTQLIIVIFAVVVIGGLGSILGSVVAGFSLGVIEGLTNVFYSEGAGVVVFVVMVLILLLRPAGLFGKDPG